MRTTLLAITLAALGGCTLEPASKPGPAQAATDDTGSTVAATNVEQAQQLGYRVVNENGETLYCREERRVGSHLHKERTCLTEQEMTHLRETSQRNFEKMKNVITAPVGK